MSYKIVIDSCGELLEQWKQDERFASVPLTLTVGSENIIDDETFNQADFLQKVAACPECPKSACPSPESYRKAFDCEAEHIYCVTLSSELSGSYNLSLIHICLSINSENIFPIIKKWLYSDHDIFARELISNGCDAITKLKKLDVMGEYTLPDDYKAEVQVIVNPEEKTLKFIDTGLGMTADEVEEYITQIAFSGATEFLSKYKDKTTDDQIIGHFGLGFYSAFMVADEVHIDTLSYKEGAAPVRCV